MAALSIAKGGVTIEQSNIESKRSRLRLYLPVFSEVKGGRVVRLYLGIPEVDAYLRFLKYRCYRKGKLDNIPLSPDRQLMPCSCPEVKAEVVEPAVWQAICQLIKDPELLIEELDRSNGHGSPTREILERELNLCQERLKMLPREQRRLVEGYRKGLYPDFMMREEMEQIGKEQRELEKRKGELERQLARTALTADREARIRRLVEHIDETLHSLDLAGRQELLRLLVEKVCYDGATLEIQTIIPLGEKLRPLHRGGLRG